MARSSVRVIICQPSKPQPLECMGPVRVDRVLGMHPDFINMQHNGVQSTSVRVSFRVVCRRGDTTVILLTQMHAGCVTRMPHPPLTFRPSPPSG